MSKNNIKCLMLNIKLNSKFKIQNSKLSRSGFTLIELVFVIVLIGILTSVASNFIPDNRLLNDVNFLTMKIKQKQRNAIGYSTYHFGNPLYWSYSKNNCIDLNTTNIKKIALNEKKSVKFSSSITVNGDDGNSTICFDEYGRAFHSGYILHNELDINLSISGSKQQSKSFSIMPESGFIILH